MSDDSTDEFLSSTANAGGSDSDEENAVPQPTESNEEEESSASSEKQTKVPSEDDQKSFYEVVQMRAVAANKPILFLTDIDTWDDYDELDDKPSFEEQEADDDSSFREDSCGFTIKHLTVKHLDRIGKYITDDDTSKFAGWMVVHEPDVAPGKDLKQRMNAVGRQYNGVAFDPKKRTMAVFRYDLDSNGREVPVLMDGRYGRKHFSFAYKDEATMTTVVVNKNKRLTKYVTPHYAEVTLTMPFVPDGMMQGFRKTLNDAKKVKSEQPALSVDSVKEKAPSKPKKTLIKKEMAEAAAAAAKPAKKALEAAAAAVESPKAVVEDSPPIKKQSKLFDAADAVMKQAAKVPAAAVEPKPKKATQKRKAASSDVVDEDDKYAFFVSMDKTPKKLKMDTLFSLSSLMSHFRYKVENENFHYKPLFEDKKTWGDVYADENSRYAATMLALGLKELAPHLFGRAAPPDIPDKLPRIDVENLL
jgi:hypothetical protein